MSKLLEPGLQTEEIEAAPTLAPSNGVQAEDLSTARGPGFPMVYTGTWAVLCAISVGYLSVTILDATPALRLSSGPIIATQTTVSDTPSSSSVPSLLRERLAEKSRSVAAVADELGAYEQDAGERGTADTAAVEPQPRQKFEQRLSAPPQAADGSPVQNGPGVLASKPVKTTSIDLSGSPAIASTETTGASAKAAADASGSPGISVLNAPTATRVSPVKPTGVAHKTTEVPAGAIPSGPAGRSAPIETGSIKPPPLPIRSPPPPADFVKRAIAAKAREAAQPVTQLRETVAPVKGFETTAVARAQPVRVPPVVSRSLNRNQAPLMGVKLAYAPSIDALRLQWTLLRERHSQYLGGMSPRYIQSSVNGGASTYELIAGPVNGAMQALELCQDVSRLGTRCVIGDFVGNAL